MARQQDKSVLLYDGVSAPTIEAIEGTATQTYEIGDLVKFEDDGRIVVATNSVVAAIAQMDATGTAGSASDKQFIELINFNALYLITAGASTAAAQVNVGEVSAITYTIGAHIATPGAGEVFIVGIYPGDVAVSGGRYIVRFNASDLTAIGD